MWTIARKELADQFSSTRFLLLFSLILMVALITSYMAATHIREALEGVAKPSHVFLLMFTTPGKFISLTQFIAFFGPLLGIIMGFDAINRERQLRTLSKVLSQPVFRDDVINGKFLAGIITIGIVVAAMILLVTGMGMLAVGVEPGPEEIGRLLIYLLITAAYVAFWLGLAILFSIIFRSLATSALAAGAVWVLFSFFIGFASDLVANAVAPVDNPRDPEQIVAHERASETASLVSPVVLYSEATGVVLDPFRRSRSGVVMMGMLEQLSLERFQSPLPLDQSILVAWPYLTLLVGTTLAVFWLAYWVFMRQEVRAV
ncbi:MAG: ABC transporter permease [Verrucomicrobia bacterium]|nr:ABC transporter permease [Verrucomicrobiota bacterium]